MDDSQIDASDPQEPGAIIKSMHHWQRVANQRAIENSLLKTQLAKSLGILDTRSDEESEAAKEIKSEVVQAMRDMLPQAKRAAKRGKPALLRLIVRTIRTKL